MSREHRVVVVTREGRPIANPIPHQEDGTTGIFSSLSGVASVHGDIVAPIEERVVHDVRV